MLLNWKVASITFCKVVHKIKDRMREVMQMNRAKMNYLQILWDDTVAKLTYLYASKNKKKEFTQFIA